MITCNQFEVPLLTVVATITMDRTYCAADGGVRKEAADDQMQDGGASFKPWNAQVDLSALSPGMHTCTQKIQASLWHDVDRQRMSRYCPLLQLYLAVDETSKGRKILTYIPVLICEPSPPGQQPIYHKNRPAANHLRHPVRASAVFKKINFTVGRDHSPE